MKYRDGFMQEYLLRKQMVRDHIEALVQDCSNSSALAMQLLQSCSKSSTYSSFSEMIVL